jgi:uncharacterized damage-inducible protein DinB
MRYEFSAIPEDEIPLMKDRSLQYALNTYVSETNKVVSTWRGFDDAELDFTPHPKSMTVLEILEHQLLSERRFFGECLGTPEPPPEDVLPPQLTVETCWRRCSELAKMRLPFFARQESQWWQQVVPFFDAQRERVWIFWRRLLHTAHHRTQLTVYLRLLDKPVPAIYGPTAAVTWKGADPTTTTEAAARK